MVRDVSVGCVGQRVGLARWQTEKLFYYNSLSWKPNSTPSGMTLTDETSHMHFLGREFIATATLPDSSERPLVRIADWDFRWQNTFVYREPVHLSAGNRIEA